MPNVFYVIGASGAGKDSLLRFAREQQPPGAPVAFAHRYITRPAHSAGENHVELSNDEFQTRLEHGCFAMHWESHGLRYGIGVEIRHWLQQGMHVVLNGSREYLDKAAADFSNLVPVLIQVDASVLQERLSGRGRETPNQIKQRLRRHAQFERQVEHPGLVCIDNSSDLSAAGQQLLDLLTSSAT